MDTEKFIDEKIKSGFLNERYNEDGTTSVIGEHSYLCEIIDDLFKQRLEASPLETLVNCPKPFTAEFLTYLLVNALRNLNEAQRHNLAISLAVRDSLFTIEEYEEQLGN